MFTGCAERAGKQCLIFCLFKLSASQVKNNYLSSTTILDDEFYGESRLLQNSLNISSTFVSNSQKRKFKRKKVILVTPLPENDKLAGNSREHNLVAHYFVLFLREEISKSQKYSALYQSNFNSSRNYQYSQLDAIKFQRKQFLSNHSIIIIYYLSGHVFAKHLKTSVREISKLCFYHHVPYFRKYLFIYL